MTDADSDPQGGFPGLVAPDGAVALFDTAASAQKPQAVVDAMNRALGAIMRRSIAGSMAAAHR